MEMLFMGLQDHGQGEESRDRCVCGTTSECEHTPAIWCERIKRVMGETGEAFQVCNHGVCDKCFHAQGRAALYINSSVNGPWCPCCVQGALEGLWTPPRSEEDQQRQYDEEQVRFDEAWAAQLRQVLHQPPTPAAANLYDVFRRNGHHTGQPGRVRYLSFQTQGPPRDMTVGYDPQPDDLTLGGTSDTTDQSPRTPEDTYTGEAPGTPP